MDHFLKIRILGAYFEPEFQLIFNKLGILAGSGRGIPFFSNNCENRAEFWRFLFLENLWNSLNT